MNNHEDSIFPMSEANSILFKGLPNTDCRFPGQLEYSRPTFYDANRTISKEYRALKVQGAIAELERELHQYAVDLTTDDWISLVKSLEGELQYIAYAYYYWTRKSVPTLKRILEKEGARADIPHFEKEHNCESCGSAYQLTFTKSRTMSADSCPLCRHPNADSLHKEICRCNKCAAPDTLVLENVALLLAYIDKWIEERRTIIDRRQGDRDKIKQSILERWRVSSVVGQSYLHTTLDRLCFNAISAHDGSACICRLFNVLPEEYSDIDIVASKPQVFVLSGSPQGKGYLDFMSKFSERDKLDFSPQFINTRDPEGLSKTIAKLAPQPGEVIVVVRGGGDISHATYNAFRSDSAAAAINETRGKGVFCIVGIGHSDGTFQIERYADKTVITPPEAANELRDRLTIHARRRP
jgi:hypothetical protein